MLNQHNEGVKKTMAAADIFAKINASYSSFTKSEKRVADFVFQYPEKVLYTSITDFGELCGVGDTTVFRFCKALELNGYQDFKMLLAQAIAGSDGDNSVAGEVSLEDDTLSICQKALSTSISALNETFNLLDVSRIKKASQFIFNANSIHFFGMGSSGVAAYEARLKFMRILPNVQFNPDCHVQYMTAALMSTRDLAVAFSYSGSAKDIIEIMKIAKSTGCKTVCITRHVKSALANLCDVVLQCGSNEGPLQGGSLSTIIAQLYILDVLYLQYYVDHYDKARDNNTKTTE
ncbi:MAG: MurR/RpiR family transcriptional regulator, partial [Oscillospiraceae bacterium]